MTSALHTSALTSLPLLARGKVRDNYAVGDDRILMVASDRISAFDVIMGEPIPGKGELLTQMALFWFDKLGHMCPNHLTGDAPESVVSPEEVPQVRAAPCWCKRLKPIPSRPWCAATWPAAAGRNTRRASRCAACPCRRA
jgi:phosphoribosylaminoimidazole-succinocarboxamide synthase